LRAIERWRWAKRNVPVGEEEPLEGVAEDMEEALPEEGEPEEHRVEAREAVREELAEELGEEQAAEKAGLVEAQEPEAERVAVHLERETREGGIARPRPAIRITTTIR